MVRKVCSGTANFDEPGTLIENCVSEKQKRVGIGVSNLPIGELMVQV
jgi:hypothetical protein